MGYQKRSTALHRVLQGSHDSISFLLIESFFISVVLNNHNLGVEKYGARDGYSLLLTSRQIASILPTVPLKSFRKAEDPA